MQLDNQEESQNVEDRRSMAPGGMVVGGGVGTIVLALIVWFLGGDPMQLFQQKQGQPGMPGQFGGPMQPGGGNGGAPPQDAELTHFVKIVLGDTEVVWGDLFRQNGKVYRQPKLVLFNGAVQSGCGFTGAAVGPFYCPEDEKVYLDLSFYRDLKTKFGAPGNFAEAYVIAHEVGHHVQKLLGVSDQVEVARRRATSKVESNRLSVCLELQADFLAGVWAHHAQERFKFLDPGDIEDALRCAQAIGDDRLQMQARGTVVPDSFTHGSSAQRMRWFKLGWTTGDMSQGDTFNAKEL
jgi:uncharacterized protein